MDRPNKKQKQQTLFSAFRIQPRTTGRGTRPALEKFSTFTARFSDPETFKALDSHDANEQRLLSAMRAAQHAYHTTSETDFTKRAGYINEARQYHAVFDKYQKMTPEERSDRVYLPQMNLFHDDARGSFRRPDMVKLKRKQGEFGDTFHATAVEFKSSSHEPEQRSETARLLSDPGKLRGTFEQLPWRAREEQIYHFRDVPLTRYKTRFSGAKPVTTETLDPTEKQRLSHAGVSVSSKTDPSK